MYTCHHNLVGTVQVMRGDLMNAKGKRTTMILCMSLLLGGGLATTQSAFAASGDPGYVLAFTNIYSGPADWYSVDYITEYDALIPLQCYTDTQDYSGGPWHRWFKLNQSNSWVRSDRVEQQPVLPHC